MRCQGLEALKIWTSSPLKTTVRLVVLTLLLTFLLSLNLQSASLGNTSNYAKTYDEIWQLVDEHFLFRDRLKNWSGWRHKFDSQLTDQERLDVAVANMIGSLKDSYTFYRDSDATTARRALDDEKDVVTYKKLPDRIGYIRISGFCSKLCIKELKEALTNLSNCQGYILDLQDNSGGCVDIAFETFALLCPQGDFVSMKGTSEEESCPEKWYLEKDTALIESSGEVVKSLRLPNYTGKKPLVVLINNNTRSAAEMLAGALQDNARAILLGKQTFGKGIVQRVWDLPDNTSVKISSAYYYLPLGRAIHGIGVKPDIIIDSEPLLDKASTLIRSKQIARAEN